MAGWPEGNFFPPFTPPREAAAQINYCLESPVHKVEKKKERNFRAEAEKWLLHPLVQTACV